MNKIDLNSVDGLTQLLNELSNVIDSKINKVKLNENINKVNELSFFECKQLFDNMSANLFETKNGKKYIAKYVKLIKENRCLREVFTLYESFIKENQINNTQLFVTESCNYINSMDYKLYKKGVNEVRQLIKKALKECALNDNDFNNIINENSEINKAITFVFENKKSAKNMNLYTENISTIVNYLDNNKQSINENAEIVKFEDLKGIFDNNLELWENAVIEKLVLCNMSDGNKGTLFEEYKTKCLQLIEETLNDEDITLETKTHLTTMKTQLNEKVYKEETANDDILKLANLEYTLLN
jgi:hypothetical protein